MWTIVQLNPDTPLPAKFIQPWITDNIAFVNETKAMASRLQTEAPIIRQRLQKEGRIFVAQAADPTPLSAVDAALTSVDLFDHASILLQVVRVEDDGTTILGEQRRVTGVNGHVLQMLRTPLRLASECSELAVSSSITIADTSYWSMLMEVNLAITRHVHLPDSRLTAALNTLLKDGIFIRMLKNEHVIAMSKQGESDRILSGISDRRVLEFVLEAGEFTKPIRLVDGTAGGFGVEKFGIEKRGFTDGERQWVQEFYNNHIGLCFFKPHDWSRAYRIEAHLDRLQNPDWLMPLLAAISRHTKTRNIVEPWPQFMADYVSKHLAAVSQLYGTNNQHRLPVTTPTRTKTN